MHKSNEIRLHKDNDYTPKKALPVGKLHASLFVQIMLSFIFEIGKIGAKYFLSQLKSFANVQLTW